MALAAAGLCAAFAADGAAAARSDWVDIDEGRMRLLLARAEDGRVTGGIEIALEPGWHTYWRNPGDSGVPPVFDFSASRNLTAGAVRFPAPQRLDEDGLVSNIYEDSVVMPVAVDIADPAATARLAVSAMLGVCREICIPVRAEAEVTLAPDDADPLARVVLARAERALPAAPEPGRFAVRSVTRDADALTIAIDVPQGAEAPALFVAAPAEIHLPGQPVLSGTEGGVARFTLALGAAAGDEASAGPVLDLVAVAGGEAIQQSVAIPAPGDAARCSTCRD